MMAINKRINWPNAVVIAALALFAAYQTQANRQADPPPPLPPAVLATIDIEEVFYSLDERSDADARLTALGEELEIERTAMEEELKVLAEDLQTLLQPGTPAYQKAEEELVWKSSQLRAFTEFGKLKLDREQSNMLRTIYDHMKTTIKALSEENGYDVVSVNDSKVSLPQDVPEAEMMREISARRMLYTNPQLDITQQLIARMNADFSSGP